MDPETDELFFAGESCGLDEQTSQHHSGKVPEVEDVVGLGGSWEEVGHSLLVHIHSGRHHHVPTLVVFRVKLLPLYPTIMSTCDHLKLHEWK